VGRRLLLGGWSHRSDMVHQRVREISLEVVPRDAAAQLLHGAALIDDAGRRIGLQVVQQQMSQQQGAVVVSAQSHLHSQGGFGSVRSTQLHSSCCVGKLVFPPPVSCTHT